MKGSMKYIVCIWLFIPVAIFAQDKEQEKVPQEPVKINLTEKQILRKGNDLYKQKRYVDAEVSYKKALKENPNYETAGYNLANAMYEQNRFEEALPQYELVAKSAGDNKTREKSFHNIGNVMMKQKQYDKAIAAYKNSLLLNPKDEETRYNLALAQKLLKDQEQNNQNQDQDKDQDKDKNKDQDKEENKDKDQNSENKDQQDDQGDDEKKDQDQNEGDNENENNDQDQKNEDQNEGDKKDQQKQPQPDQLSQQQIQQLLEAMNNEENKTQQKVNAKKAKGKKLNQEKDW
jgi:tetratricopeptide (TPR) repeat protein